MMVAGKAELKSDIIVQGNRLLYWDAIFRWCSVHMLYLYSSKRLRKLFSIQNFCVVEIEKSNWKLSSQFDNYLGYSFCIDYM